jgi:hypothetical protein
MPFSFQTPKSDSGYPFMSDGNSNKNRMQYPDQIMGFHGKKKPSFTGIDENFW